MLTAQTFTGYLVIRLDNDPPVRTDHTTTQGVGLAFPVKRWPDCEGQLVIPVKVQWRADILKLAGQPRGHFLVTVGDLLQQAGPLAFFQQPVATQGLDSLSRQLGQEQHGNRNLFQIIGFRWENRQKGLQHQPLFGRTQRPELRRPGLQDQLDHLHLVIAQRRRCTIGRNVDRAIAIDDTSGQGVGYTGKFKQQALHHRQLHRELGNFIADLSLTWQGTEDQQRDVIFDQVDFRGIELEDFRVDHPVGLRDSGLNQGIHDLHLRCSHQVEPFLQVGFKFRFPRLQRHNDPDERDHRNRSDNGEADPERLFAGLVLEPGNVCRIRNRQSLLFCLHGSASPSPKHLFLPFPTIRV